MSLQGVEGGDGRANQGSQRRQVGRSTKPWLLMQRCTGCCLCWHIIRLRRCLSTTRLDMTPQYSTMRSSGT
jgi:hypothetical protein